MFMASSLMSLDIFSSIFDFFTETIPEFIGSAITNALSSLIGKCLYYIIVKGLLGIVRIVYQFFEIFAGLKKVEYDGKKSYLLNVFFDNSLISKIYWGMACIGFVMIFAFAILALIRKIFDIDDKHQKPISSILKNCFKGIFTILVTSLCVTGVLNSTNVLMQSVSYLFDNAELIGKSTGIEYTDTQFSTMARVLNTIGNYSLNPSYESRYNVNSCFNEIREDLADLQNQGVFGGHYETKNENNETIENWMTVLQSIVESADISRDVYMNVYYESLSKAMIAAMDTLKNNSSLSALKSYSWPVYSANSQDVSLDRALFLSGTTTAAKNSAFNKNAEITDSLRGPFYTGEKDIYNIKDVNASFDIKLGSIDYVLIALCAFFVIKYLFRAIMQCSTRIFTMLGLYVVAPPFAAVMPWDDGEKFKQWTQSFIIQAFGVFGTVIPMRLFIVFIPIVLSNKLVLFPNSSLFNIIGKVFLIIGGIVGVDSFGQMFSGILAGNGAMASAGAVGQAGAVGDKAFGVAAGATGKVLGAGMRLGGGVAKGALGFVGAVTGATALANKVKQGVNTAKEFLSEGFDAFKKGGGLGGMAVRGIKNHMGMGNKD